MGLVRLVASLVALDVLLAPSRTPRPSYAARWVGPGRETRPPRRSRCHCRAAGSAELLRDAWQPSAGAAGNRHRLDLAAGARAALTSDLRPDPTRRPDRPTG